VAARSPVMGLTAREAATGPGRECDYEIGNASLVWRPGRRGRPAATRERGRARQTRALLHTLARHDVSSGGPADSMRNLFALR